MTTDYDDPMGEGAQFSDHIDMDRVLVDPDYRRRVINQLRKSRVPEAGGPRPALHAAKSAERR